MTGPTPEDERALLETAKAFVVAVLTGAGAVAGGPMGAGAGGLASQGAVSLIDALESRWRRHQQEQAGAAVSTALSVAGLTPERLGEELARDPKVLQVAVAVLQAAAESAVAQKVELLGRVLANAATDDALVEESLLLARALRDLEAPHIRVLALLAQQPSSELAASAYWTPASLAQRLGWQLPSVTSVVLTLQAAGAAVLTARIIDGGEVDGTFTISDESPLADMACDLTDFGKTILDGLGSIDPK